MMKKTWLPVPFLTASAGAGAIAGSPGGNSPAWFESSTAGTAWHRPEGSIR